MENIRIIKGNIIFTKNLDKFEVIENGYIVYEGELIIEVTANLSEKYKDIGINDYGNNIIIPGFCDLHSHASQFENIGQGMDYTLLPWLENLTFPTEAKFSDIDYAKIKYSEVVELLYKHGTTRSALFTTIHSKSSQVLIDLMEEKGLAGYVGKVNMTRNCPEYLCEDSLESIEDTKLFIERNYNNKRVKPIITPRFVPSCDEKTLMELGKIVKEMNLPIQSHINENIDEIKWVKDLHVDSKHYADVYNSCGLLNNKTLMAHCIYMSQNEIDIFIEKGVTAVHCPHSNANVSSGAMQTKKLLHRGMKIGLGSDISGGNDVSIAKVIVLAIQVSKLRHAVTDEGFLTLSESFYMATKGGGKFFGKVGSFEEGYELDALVIDDSSIGPVEGVGIEQRLSRYLYSGDDRHIVSRYVKGKQI